MTSPIEEADIIRSVAYSDSANTGIVTMDEIPLLQAVQNMSNNSTLDLPNGYPFPEHISYVTLLQVLRESQAIGENSKFGLSLSKAVSIFKDLGELQRVS